MSLSMAQQIARSGLAATSLASSVVSRNVAAADDPNASAKLVRIATDLSGVRVVSIANAVDTTLFEQTLSSGSAASELSVKLAGLDELQRATGVDPTSASSPAALLGQMKSALLLAAAAPHDVALARSAISVAERLATSISDGAAALASFRERTGNEIEVGVNRLNGLLGELQQANRRISAADVRGEDVTDLVDQRKVLIKDVSELVDVRVAQRAGNQVVLYLASGATLLETSPREIALNGSVSPAPGQMGAAIRVDGWPVDRPEAIGGKLGALLDLQNDVALTFGRQLDEIARGLVMATAESEQSVVPSAPPLAGVFTYAGGPTLPVGGMVVDGMAASLRINPSIDPALGGEIMRLRDGGVSAPGNPAYFYNATGAAGYSERLQELVDGLTYAQAFDPSSELGAQPASVTDFVARSSGWLEEARSLTSSRQQSAQVLAERTLSAWQNKVGINMDDQLAELISLEQSYQANSRLIASINSMFDALLRAVDR
jgi:flagellar hook-associated protein 1 FlgK